MFLTLKGEFQIKLFLMHSKIRVYVLHVRALSSTPGITQYPNHYQARALHTELSVDPYHCWLWPQNQHQVTSKLLL